MNNLISLSKALIKLSEGIPDNGVKDTYKNTGKLQEKEFKKDLQTFEKKVDKGNDTNVKNPLPKLPTITKTNPVSNPIYTVKPVI